jgi:soluble lytic murein transglycosylase-like protein
MASLALLLMIFAGNVQNQWQPEFEKAQDRLLLQHALSQGPPLSKSFTSPLQAANWIANMSQRLEKFIPNWHERIELLRVVHYEATRAGIDPQLALAIIEVESHFNRYAVSKAGAIGYMQVMPFWIKEIGKKDDDLFHVQTNIRYGCTILRYYLDQEKGHLAKALGRYNGAINGPYPRLVLSLLDGRWTIPSNELASLSKPFYQQASTR